MMRLVRGAAAVVSVGLASLLASGRSAGAQQSPAADGATGDPDTARRAPGAPVAFESVTIVDVQDGRLHPGQTIVVSGNRIQTIGADGHVQLPSDIKVLKASGSYVIPGLWDMHVHPLDLVNTSYPLFVANGVTGVREMSTPFLDSIARWRREIAAGTRVGPRIVTPGPFLTSPDDAAALNEAVSDRTGGKPLSIGVGTVEEARRVVDSLKRAGADFIKIRDHLSREVFFALAAETRRVGLPLAGHLNESITVVEASDSGQRSIEHGLIPGGVASRHCHFVNPPDAVAVPESVDEDCQQLATRFRQNATWFSPANPDLGSCTLFSVAGCGDMARYWPAWALPIPQETAETTAPPVDARRSLERWAAPNDSLFGEMRRAGMRFLAGTDTGPLSTSWGAVPGFSLHDVLQSFVRGGLTPLEALQSATWNPAEYFNATDSLGSVAPGKVADFVFLDANPLDDIYNTRRIRAVVADGRFFDRGDLDALLADVRRVARNTTRP